MVLRINVIWYNGLGFKQESSFLCEETEPPHLVLVGVTVGRPVEERTLYFKIFKILYRLNHLDFYCGNISTMLLIVLEMHFNLLFSNKPYFRICFMVRKTWSSC